MTAAVMKTDRRFLCPFSGSRTAAERSFYMAFFNSAVGVLQTLVIALGAGLGIWGVINLLEGYGNDNPGAKSQGMKQLMAN
jgi:ABC-type xylose transport system substrate-binding protein